MTKRTETMAGIRTNRLQFEPDNEENMKTVWKIMESRAVIPVSVEHVEIYQRDKNMCVGRDKDNNFIVNGFVSQEVAISIARTLIDKSELQARSQLLNVEKHRLHLEHSIKQYKDVK